jgi:hypothetical protein
MPLAEAAAHYPATEPARSALAAAIFALVEDPEKRAAFHRSRDGFAAGFALAPDERAALTALDCDALREHFRINPMLLYQLAQRISA